MARLWLQLACATVGYTFLQPTTQKATARRVIQVNAVADLLPDDIVNSLSEEQLTLLYNAPDAVAGALGAEAAALGEFAGKASEAFATKVVPALKEGGDALKPAVEQALTSAGVDTPTLATWLDDNPVVSLGGESDKVFDLTEEMGSAAVLELWLSLWTSAVALAHVDPLLHAHRDPQLASTFNVVRGGEPPLRTSVRLPSRTPLLSPRERRRTSCALRRC